MKNLNDKSQFVKTELQGYYADEVIASGASQPIAADGSNIEQKVSTRKSYKKLLFIVALPFFSLSAHAMEADQNIIPDGHYRIRSKDGAKSLELLPDGKGVRLVGMTFEQYQKWEVKSIQKNSGLYNISCITKMNDPVYLEAFPLTNSVSTKAKNSDDDQEWRFRKIEEDVYQIYCDTEYFGIKYLEAFPFTNSVGVKDRTLKLDQMWELIKWKS